MPGRMTMSLKPFEATELLERGRAIQRRAPASAEDAHFEAGHLTIDFNSRNVTVGGREINLQRPSMRCSDCSRCTPGKSLRRSSC